MLLTTTLKGALTAIAGEQLVQQLSSCKLDADQLCQLHQLAFIAEQQGCLSCLDEDIVASQIAEYESEAARLQQQLDIIGFGEEHLSAASKHALEQLAATGSALDLAQVSDATLTAAWALLVCQETQAQGVKAKIERQVIQLSKASARMTAGLQELEQSMTAASKKLDDKEAAVQDYYARASEFIDKAEKRKKELAELKRRYESSGYHPEIEQHRLVDLSNENDKKAAELSEQQQIVNSYLDLPPSQLRAELKLRQAKEQLAAVTERLQHGMANLN